MHELIGSETGFRTTGILYACDTDEELERREAWLDVARPHQLDTRIVSGRELTYDVSVDGQKFLVVDDGVSSVRPLTLVQNWTAALRK